MDDNPQPGADTFLTMRDAVMEIRKDVKELGDHLDRIDREGSIGTKAELADHETRLRAGERFRYALPTAATLATIAAVAATIVSITHA